MARPSQGRGARDTVVPPTEPQPQPAGDPPPRPTPHFTAKQHLGQVRVPHVLSRPECQTASMSLTIGVSPEHSCWRLTSPALAELSGQTWWAFYMLICWEGPPTGGALDPGTPGSGASLGFLKASWEIREGRQVGHLSPRLSWRPGPQLLRPDPGRAPAAAMSSMGGIHAQGWRGPAPGHTGDMSTHVSHPSLFSGEKKAK